MDNPSRLIVLTLMVMVCVFSVVLIFKGEFREYKEREVAKEKISPQKQEVAKQENIQWTPSVLPPTPIDRTPAVIAQEEKKYEEIPEDPREIINRMTDNEEFEVTRNERGQKIIANDVIVAFSRGTSSSEVESLENRYDMILKSYDSVTGTARFKVSSQSVAPLKTLQEQIQSENPKVRYSDPNYVMHADLTTLPTELTQINTSGGGENKLWFLNNSSIRTILSGRTFPSVIGVDIAHGQFASLYSAQNPCALIAVIDSGFDITYPDLQGRIWTNTKEINNNSIDDDNNGYKDDYYGVSTAFGDGDPRISIGNYRTQSFSTQGQTLTNILNKIIELGNQSGTNNEAHDQYFRIHLDLFHGTATSSLIVANGNNYGLGTQGVGVCQTGKVMLIQSAKLKLENGIPTLLSASEAIAAGIRYAADHGAKVINASLGGPWFDDTVSNPTAFPTARCTTYNQNTFMVSSPCHIVDAVQYANSKGAILIASSGNDGANNDALPKFPANLSYETPALDVIAVGAHTADGHRWNQSNYGEHSVTLVAPGENIFTPTLSSNFQNQLPSGYTLSSLFGKLFPGNNNVYPASLYVYASGTSASAPLVSAGAAMVYQRLLVRFGSDATKDYAKAVKDILKNSTLSLSSLGASQDAINSMDKKSQTGASILDIKGSLEMTQRYASLDTLDIVGSNFTTTGSGTDNPVSDGGSGGTGITAGGDSGGGGGGGGCGYIDTGDHNNNTPSGNWPILVLYFIPLVLWLRKRALVMQRWSNRRR